MTGNQSAAKFMIEYNLQTNQKSVALLEQMISQNPNGSQYLQGVLAMMQQRVADCQAELALLEGQNG